MNINRYNLYMWLVLMIGLIVGQLFPSAALAKSITVTGPAAGATWQKNVSATVTWSKSGGMGKNVKINLLNQTGNAVVLPIVGSAPNSGSYTIPSGFFSSVPSGDYIIRVRTTDNEVYGNSGIFHLKDGTASQGLTQKPMQKGIKPQAVTPKPIVTAIKPSIYVTIPAPGEAWRRDTAQTVSWSRIGTMGPNVTITLSSTTGAAIPFPVTNSAPNTGNYTIPDGVLKDLPFGDYTIRVQTTDETAMGNSGVFKLVGGPLNIPQVSFIKVLQPVTNDRFQEGDKITVRFESNLAQPFQLALVDSGSKEKIMDCQIGAFQQQNANTIVAEWTTPEWDYSILTKYCIRVSKGSIHSFSAPFVIQNILKTTAYEIPVTITTNKLRYRSHNDNANRETPDPGPGRLRVGYSHFSFEDHFRNYIYRSWVFFDLKSLQGKGLVTKAALNFSHYAGCNTFTPIVKLLNTHWSGDAGALFSFSSEMMSGINPSSLPVTRVTNWITKPDNNHGLVFIGPNETLFASDNNICVGLYDNVKLVVEMTK